MKTKPMPEIRRRIENKRLRELLSRNPGARLFCINSGVRALSDAQSRTVKHVGSFDNGKVIVIEYYE